MKLLTALLMTAALSLAQNAPNILTPAESQDGWKLLFDGKSLDGWQGLPTFPPLSNGDWGVENGSLICGGTTPSWLSGAASFSNFHLKLEFRGPEKVNSGVFLRSQKEGQPHQTGYELQIWDYQPGGYITGSLVGAAKAGPAKIIPDQWNSYDITADGDHFVIILNGKTLLDAHDSKHASGVVGFQCQKDNRIEFRNVKIRPI